MDQIVDGKLFNVQCALCTGGWAKLKFGRVVNVIGCD